MDVQAGAFAVEPTWPHELVGALVEAIVDLRSALASGATPRTLVVHGPAGSGKTCLLRVRTRGRNPCAYIAIVLRIVHCASCIVHRASCVVQVVGRVLAPFGVTWQGEDPVCCLVHANTGTLLAVSAYDANSVHDALDLHDEHVIALVSVPPDQRSPRAQIALEQAVDDALYANLW